MDLLQQARAEIDTVDAEMAALFERRMRAVADVVRYKAETGKPVFDAAREAAVLICNILLSGWTSVTIVLPISIWCS